VTFPRWTAEQWKAWAFAQLATTDESSTRADFLRTIDLLPGAMNAADRGNIEPLAKLYPHLRPYLKAKRKGQGKRARKYDNPFLVPSLVAVERAAEDSKRIRALWKSQFGRTNSPFGITADALAAKYNGIKVSDLIALRKRSSKSERRKSKRKLR
jgi:hypothetical protein